MTAQHLTEYLEASAARCPDRVALVDSAGGSASYAELNRQANALAAFLWARGVQRGDRIGVVLPKGIPAVAALFGIMKAGAAYVPVDHTAPVERSRRILMDCRIRALFVDGHSLAAIPDVEGSEPLAAVIVVGPGRPPTIAGAETDSFDAALAKGLGSVPASHSPTDLAYILYTSGSTGMPKGVMISHENALSFIEWCSGEFTPTEHDRFNSHAPFHFDASVLDIYLTIKHGATLYLISDDLARNATELAQFIAASRLTVWFSTPSALTLLVQFGNLGAFDASSLRLVLFGGEVFPVKYLRELRRHWASATYYNLYGPTEITVACTYARLPDVVPADREIPYPIGVPCSHCQALVLDPGGHEVAPGEEGLLHISGPSVFAGYWNRPEENAAVFVHRAGVRWYNTGDVVRWDPVEGFTYVGRRDRMVKRRGFRIELGEIERALYSHPRLHEVAVVSVPDPTLGVKIVAFCSSDDRERLPLVELKKFCASRIPSYMSPDRFVFQERLPRTSSDKVDYESLKRQLLSSPVAASAGS